MINTILLDLDGTLLGFTQEAFFGVYFTELKKVFTRLNMDAELAVQAVWAGTKAMVKNDGSRLNTVAFWGAFTEHMGLTADKLSAVEAACDDFYTNEFDVVKSIVAPTEIPKRLVRSLTAKGYTVVLATNPFFPPCAITTRLNWAGLTPEDFHFITHYENSRFSKPNLGYYKEIFTKVNRAPEQCLMAGNNPAEDLCVGALGAETFLVTDFMENEAGVDIAHFRRGDLAELEQYLLSLPDLSAGSVG